MSANVLSRTKLASVLVDYVKTKGSTQKQAQKIAAFLIHNKRTKEIDSLMRDMMKYQAENGVLEVTATSAHQLSPEAKTRVKQLLPAKKHIINEVITPEILGGILIESADIQLDLTIRRQVQKLRSFNK